ncbi:MAG: VapB-type antitoxin [Candidatus Marsarchaeota archaeon]|nr:VapB-type antitoxin [Candidatus Marsarchaeota archaeon]
MDSEVISVRVAKEAKEALEKEGVDVSYEFKNYIKRRLALLRLRKTVKELEPIIRSMKPSKRGFAVRSVREDRDAGH